VLIAVPVAVAGRGMRVATA